MGIFGDLLHVRFLPPYHGCTSRPSADSIDSLVIDMDELGCIPWSWGLGSGLWPSRRDLAVS